jgi:hypothetical protein
VNAAPTILDRIAEARRALDELERDAIVGGNTCSGATGAAGNQARLVPRVATPIESLSGPPVACRPLGERLALVRGGAADL